MRKPTLDMMLHSTPRQLGFLAPALQRAVPEMTDVMPECTQGSLVHRHTVVAHVSTNDRSEPLALVGNWMMHAASQLEFYFEKFRSHLLLNRLPKNRKLSVLQRSPTDVSEAEEVERFWFPETTLLSVMSRKATELQNSRFLRVKFKTELEHTLLQTRQKLLSLRLMFKADNEIVSPSHDHHVTARFVLHSLFGPKIQDVVKVYIRKQRANGTPLRHTFFRLGSLAVQHDSGLQPFLDQPDHSLVTDSVFDKLDQPVVVEVIEKSSDIRIQNPAHFTSEDTIVQSIETVVLSLTRSVSVGASKEVRLVNRVQDFDRTSLNDFIFQNRYPQGTLLPVGLRNEHSSYGLRSIGSSLHALGQIFQVYFQIFSVALPRFAVDTGGGTSLHRKVARPKSVDVRHMVHEVRELNLLIAFRDLTYTIKRTLHVFLGLLSPRRVLLFVFPLVRRLPSIPLRRRHCIALVRELRRYFASIRLPSSVHHRLVSLDFTMRTFDIASKAERGISRFSRRLIGCMLKVSDPAEYSRLSPLRDASCCLPDISKPSALGFNILTGLNTWPTSNPVNASSTLLQAHPHDSGSLPMANRLKVNRNTNNQSAGLSRRTEIFMNSTQKNDNAIQKDVVSELLWDPRVKIGRAHV